MFDRFETFVTAINQINRCIQKIKTNEMKDFGLKGTHVMCLFQLRRHKEGLTSSELAFYCDEDKAAISRVLSELEKEKLIENKQVEETRKYKIPVVLTKEGYNITDKMKGKIRSAVSSASDGYSEEERDIFYEVLLKVAENLKQVC